MSERVDCPDCGKNVLLTKSGAPRKHQCERVDKVEQVEQAPPPSPLVDEQPPAVRRYCRVPNCGRTPRSNGLCVSHRLRTYLVS